MMSLGFQMDRKCHLNIFLTARAMYYMDLKHGDSDTFQRYSPCFTIIIDPILMTISLVLSSQKLSTKLDAHIKRPVPGFGCWYKNYLLK